MFRLRCRTCEDTTLSAPDRMPPWPQRCPACYSERTCVERTDGKTAKWERVCGDDSAELGVVALVLQPVLRFIVAMTFAVLCVALWTLDKVVGKDESRRFCAAMFELFERNDMLYSFVAEPAEWASIEPAHRLAPPVRLCAAGLACTQCMEPCEPREAYSATELELAKNLQELHERYPALIDNMTSQPGLCPRCGPVAAFPVPATTVQDVIERERNRREALHSLS